MKQINQNNNQKQTPSDVLQDLKKGNRRFVKGYFFKWEKAEMERSIKIGQQPKAIILSCVDSRIPARDVFHCNVGEIFIARIAGNVINKDILGSFEYACCHSGTKLIVVMGHNYCGAIKSALNPIQESNLRTLVDKIQPAVMQAKQEFGQNGVPENNRFIDRISLLNVENAVREIRNQSEVLKEMEDSGEIRIVGAMYDMKTGIVDFLV